MTTPNFAIGAEEWPGLAKVIEECGELLQVAGRLVATGGSVEHWSGHNLTDDLIEELADVEAAIRFFVEKNRRLRAFDIARRANEKYVRFSQWHAEQGGDA